MDRAARIRTVQGIPVFSTKTRRLLGLIQLPAV